MAAAAPPGVEPEPGVGTRIGAYELVRRIGEGAMGVVFEGRHTVLGRRVAIKLLRAEHAGNPGVVARFMQEARAANLASHDNIVSVTDTGQTPGGALYLVMEYLEGVALVDVLARRRLSALEIVRIFHQVLAALGAAHAAGLVHRDLKPANVFLIRRGDDELFVKLLDFGVAKLRGVGLTAAGMVIGTPQYMAPEQVLGRPVDARTDIFAAGVVLYEAVTGEPPFRGGTLAELAATIAHGQPVPVRARVPDVPPFLERMIDRALAKDPAARWPDVHAMRAELPRLTAAQAVPERPPAHPTASPRRRRAPAIATTVAVCGPRKPASTSTMAFRSRPRSASIGSARRPRRSRTSRTSPNTGSRTKRDARVGLPTIGRRWSSPSPATSGRCTRYRSTRSPHPLPWVCCGRSRRRRL